MLDLTSFAVDLLDYRFTLKREEKTLTTKNKSVFGSRMHPYELIFHLNIEEDDVNILCFLRHEHLTFKQRRKSSLEFCHYNCHCISQFKQIWLATWDIPLDVLQGLHPNIMLEIFTNMEDDQGVHKNHA